MLEMLAEIGVDFDVFPDAFRRGSFVRRYAVERMLSAEELERIPEKHRPTRSSHAERDAGHRHAAVQHGQEPG